MGLFGKLFGNKTTLDQLRKIMAQRRYADARVLAEELLAQDLEPEAKQEVLSLTRQAGDNLAQRNLDEGLGFQRNGQRAQAQEYFELAASLVHSDELRRQIDTAIARQSADPMLDRDSDTPGGEAPDADCSLGGQDELQLDLILTSYPENMRQRYQDKSEQFKHAFLLTHAGDDKRALQSWQAIVDDERDDLYFFELGSLYGRCGMLAEARDSLEQSLKLKGDQSLAIEALVAVLQQLNDFSQAETLLRSLLDQGMNPRFCHAQLTYLYAQQGDLEKAGQQARLGLTVQNGDPSFLQLAALVFERLSCLDEAEHALKKIPAGGCGGGISLPLAEFWLRQKKELAKVLDVFNAACREDPDNPRWQLRAAQTYLARNWRKDALKLLSKVVGDPRLEPELAEEAAQQLALLQE